MLHAKESGIRSSRLGPWLVCTLMRSQSVATPRKTQFGSSVIIKHRTLAQLVRIFRSVGLLRLSLRLFYLQISKEIVLVPGISARKITPSSRVTPTITLLALNFPAFKSFKGESRIKYITRGQKIIISCIIVWLCRIGWSCKAV